MKNKQFKKKTKQNKTNKQYVDEMYINYTLRKQCK